MKMIKKLIRLSVFFCCFLGGICLAADGPKILFLGNSYVEVNDLPMQISKIAESMGDAFTYQKNTPGGCTFNGHVNNTTTISLIQQGGWDYVILQGQSQEPSFPDGQFYSQTYPYAQQLCQMVNQYNPDARNVFYMTWGRKYGDSQNCQYFPPLCTYEGMDSLLYLRYMIMAEDFGGMVSPVGALWHYLRDHHPELELYSSDNSHPSMLGTYAAACCFYTVLFQKNPSDISYVSTLTAADAQIIKDATKVVVYDSLTKWLAPSSPLSITAHDINTPFSVTISPNPAMDELNILSDNNMSEVVIYAIDGRELYRKNLNSNSETINVSFLESAIYIIQIRDDQHQITQSKFFKK